MKADAPTSTDYAAFVGELMRRVATARLTEAVRPILPEAPAASRSV